MRKSTKQLLILAAIGGGLYLYMKSQNAAPASAAGLAWYGRDGRWHGGGRRGRQGQGQGGYGGNQIDGGGSYGQIDGGGWQPSAEVLTDPATTFGETYSD